VHLSGEEAAAINVGIGAALAWGGAAWNQWRTGRHSRHDARTDRRRDSYAALILSLDGLERAWTATETLEPDDRAQTMGAITGMSLREIHQAYVAVLLADSDEARKKAKAARNAAWDLNDRLHGRNGGLDVPKLGELLNLFSNSSYEFVQLAERELG
jgi:uncharacterized membrane protein YccC